MLTPRGGSRIYLALRPVDMRKGFDGLTAQVAQVLQEDPFGGQLFLFRSRRGDRLKAVWWDGTGLCNPCSPNLCEAGRTMARIPSTRSHRHGYDRRLIVAGRSENIFVLA